MQGDGRNGREAKKRVPDAMNDHDLSPEAFAAVAARAGLDIEPDHLAHMRDGYIKLQALLARLPATPALFDEPATVFVPPGSILNRDPR